MVSSQKFMSKGHSSMNTDTISEIYTTIRKKSTRSLQCLDEFPKEVPSSNIHFPSEKSIDQAYQTAIPNTVTYSYEGLGTRIYNSKFTSDGKQLLVTSQHGTNVFNFEDDGKIELSRVIRCPNLNWTITDADISSDNKFMLHSTLSPFVHMLDLENGTYTKQFSLKNGTANVEMGDELFWFFSLRIYSLKLSGDNNQLIAACGKALGGAPVQIFDLETEQLKHSVFAHKEDINSICYLDKSNSSIFITASDDGVCKLWDTRILKNFEPVGIFYGHVSGLTSVESKEDNRYFISNCKDQSIKLWDIRSFTTEKKNYPFLKYDYRYEILSPQHIEQIKNYQKRFDQSVMSFWGHQVHSTLIRCHFSPLHGTNQRYIYTGSYDGRIYIYDTHTGENVASLEASIGEEHDAKNQVVRDCAWHPFSQNLISTSFHGDVHRWEHTDLRDAELILPENGLVEEDTDTIMYIENGESHQKNF
jgi:WD repeat-containing protein 23